MLHILAKTHFTKRKTKASLSTRHIFRMDKYEKKKKEHHLVFLKGKSSGNAVPDRVSFLRDL